MSFALPIQIAPTEKALIRADAPSKRVHIVMEACAGESPEHQKRLVTTLYEGGVLFADEAITLIALLGLKEA
jgi:hypothetical protein